MNKYAVAVLVVSGSNKVHIVEASDELDAISKAVGEKDDFEPPYSTVENAIQYYFDGDIEVSEPVLLS